MSELALTESKAEVMWHDWASRIIGSGHTTFCPRRTPNHRPIYHYTIRAKGPLLRALANLRPHMRLKGPQADLIIEYLTARFAFDGVGRYAPYNERAPDILAELRQLNLRGAAAA